MNHYLKMFLIGVAIGLVVCALLTGCATSGLYAMSDEWCAGHPEASPARCVRPHDFRWDQQALHSVPADGPLCPSAIFVAPGGVLTPCF